MPGLWSRMRGARTNIDDEWRRRVRETAARRRSNAPRSMATLMTSVPASATHSVLGSSDRAQGDSHFSHFFEGEIDPEELIVLQRAGGTPCKLGSGGFSTVYQAKLDVAMEGGWDVAVKMVKPDTMDPGTLKAFINEVQALHRCCNRNVVSCAGAFVGYREIYIVQELMERDLGSALVDPSQQEALRWRNRGQTVARDMACGLRYLHLNSILHLHIKPANILLTPGGTAQLADAGLAMSRMNRTRLQDALPYEQGPAAALSIETRADTAVSWVPTAGRHLRHVRVRVLHCAQIYMSSHTCMLQVIMGLPGGPKSDIFACGVVLWEICTHERPTRGVLRALRCPEECPQDVADVIAWCLEPTPSNRPAATELARAMEGLHT